MNPNFASPRRYGPFSESLQKAIRRPLHLKLSEGLGFLARVSDVHPTTQEAMAKYMRIESRSCIIVASGPLPNAGSLPRRRIAQGSAMAINVATEHAANSETETAIATSPSPQYHSATGKNAEESTKPVSNPESSSGLAVCLKLTA